MKPNIPDKIWVTKCNTFALKDRVAYSETDGDARVSAASMPLHTFLPCQEDYANLKERMVVIVQRILREHSALYGTAQAVDHIPHKHSSEASLKSEFVSCPPNLCEKIVLLYMDIHVHVLKYIVVHVSGTDFYKMQSSKIKSK